MAGRRKAAKDSTAADVRGGGIVTDSGGRPVTDAGGRPVFAAPDGALVLDSVGTPPQGTPTATGTTSPPAP